MSSTSTTSKPSALKPIDTELAFASSIYIQPDPDMDPTSKSSCPKTPATSSAQSSFSLFSESNMPRLLGRRQRTRSFGPGQVDESEALAYDGDEGNLTRTGSFLYRVQSACALVRYTLYVFPAATLLALPVIIAASPPHNNARIDGIRLLGLFIWIEIAWLAFWVAHLVARALPILFQAACALISTGIRKYSLVLKALRRPLSILIWTILCFASSDVIIIFDKHAYRHHHKGEWVTTLKHVFRISIIAAAVVVIEKTVIQLLTVSYYRKQYARKIRESKRLIRLLEMLYDTSRKLFPEFSKDFKHEDIEIHSPTLVNSLSKLDQRGIGVGSKILNNAHRARGKAAAAFGHIASDVTGQQLSNTAHAHSVVSKALENERSSKALARRLFLSLCSSGKTAIYKWDIQEVLGPEREDEAEEIFDVLDRDGNGDVSLEEITTLIINCGNERKDRASSIQDISSAISVLDKILSTVVVIIIAFLYAVFFSKAFANGTKSLWTALASLAFAIGGTVTEFFACCIFLFVKHPYDVGDRVNIEEEELIVKHISLMYSIFKRVEDESIVQIPHNIANTLWIGNVSRSKAMKERYNVKVQFSTRMEDILALRKEMELFVNHPDNCHDFMPDFDIELTGIDNLNALELRIEIRHKSNWADESVRLHRRNKFMCELLAAIQRIHIERPGGNWGPANPSFVSELTSAEFQVFRQEKAEKLKHTKKYANTDILELLPEGPEGKILSPAQALFPGLRKRNGKGDEGVSKGRRPSARSPM